MTDYHDFDLQIRSSGSLKYEGKVLSSPGGDSAPCPLNFKFIVSSDPKDLEIFRFKIELAVLKGEDARRRGPISPSESVLREFGRDAFRSLFVDADPIRDAYLRSKGSLTAAQSNKLRIKLRIEPAELVGLPWEYLYDEMDTPSYLGLKLPLIRHLDVSTPPRTIQINGPLHILGMIANPSTGEWRTLNEAKERRQIEQAVDKLKQQGRVVFEWVQGSTGQALLSKLMEKDWHVFHFIGHGGSEAIIRNGDPNDQTDGGFLVFVNENGEPVKKYSSELATLLDGSPSLKLAVLNCCESGKSEASQRFGSPAAALIRSGLSAVIAMQYPIGDSAAVGLAEGFYKAIAANRSVEAALTMGRRFIQDASRIEWGIPVLYMRTVGETIFRLPDFNDMPVTSNEVVEVKMERSDDVNAVNDEKGQATPDGVLDDATSIPCVNKFEKLVARGKAALDFDPDSTELKSKLAGLYFELGKAQLSKNDVSKAIASFGYAVELDARQPEVRISRANLNARVGFYEFALADIDEAIKIAPDNPEYFWNKGIVKCLAAAIDNSPGLLKEAILAFSDALRIKPDEARYLGWRATAHAKLAQTGAALADIDRAIGLQPNNADLIAQRATIRMG